MPRTENQRRKYYENLEESRKKNREQYYKHREKRLKYASEYRRKNPEKVKEIQHNSYVKNREKYRSRNRDRDKKKRKAQALLFNNPEKYPLKARCEFCGSHRNLEHGHIDYDYPELYLTVCHTCNYWMDNPIGVD